VETRTLLLLLLGLAVLVVAGSLAVGSVRLSAADLIAAFRGADLPATEIVWRLRAPRIAAAFCAGGLLAVAGVFLQALLRNPLADPYVFGVSGGAALGVLAAMAFGLPAVWGGGLGLAGALLVALLVAALAWRAADWSPYRLLLAGVVIAAGLNALIGLLLVLAPATTAKGMLFWLMGDLSYAEPPYPGTALLAGLVAIGVMLGQPMNALEIGRLKAASLGIEVRRLEIALYFAAAAATTAAVLAGGTIGFVGLIVPHLIRLAGAHDNRVLVPASALCGGSLLVLADTAARSVWAPLQLPVGILTALAGVPVLLLLLARRDHAAR